MTKDCLDYLAHYGVPGQQWGKRRWQNEDGTYTEEGKHHYGWGYGRQAAANPVAKPPSNTRFDRNKTEYLEMENGKKVAMEPYGMYAYMSTGKEVGAHLRDLARMHRISAQSMKDDAEYYALMKTCERKYMALASKYGSMKYSDINFEQLKKESNAIDDINGRVISGYGRKHKLF